MIELKPCPFCGGEAEFVETVPHYNHYVQCKKCAAMVGRTSRQWDSRHETLWFKNDTDAIKAWNRRAE